MNVTTSFYLSSTRLLRTGIRSALWAVVLAFACSQVFAQGIRVAVVGGIDLCGVWPRLAARLSSATGVPIETVSAGPKESIMPFFKRGDVDLLLIHGGDEAFALADAGVAGAMTVWGFNEHVIVGPEDDPADVASARNAAEALQKIVAVGGPFVAFRDPGSHAIVQRLIRRAGIHATRAWVMQDETLDPHDIVSFAAERRAYFVTGHIPLAFGKLKLEGQRIVLRGDPEMRRAYVAWPPGPRHRASGQTRARVDAVLAYLVSSRGQQDLVEANAETGGPWIFPRSVPQSD